MPSKLPGYPKVMHVVLSLSAGGGAESLVRDLMHGQALVAERPVVCCLQLVGALGRQLQDEGFSVYCRSKKDGVDLSAIGWLAGVMRRERVEVVHAHQYTPMFYAVPAAFLAGGAKVIYTEHGRLYPDLRSWKRALLNPFLALGIEQIISISEGTKKAMAEIDNFSEAKIAVIHNGIKPPEPCPVDLRQKRSELGIPEGCRVIGSAARLEEVKNLPMMLHAFRLIQAEKPGTLLLVAGRGSQEQNLKALARELGIEEQVRFLGLRSDLPDLYRLMEVFLLSSYSEGISLTLLESMSAGVPPVVTGVGGNPEVVVDGACGYVVPLGDHEAMAGRVLSLLDDEPLCRRFSVSARERVLAEFGFDKMLDAYNRLYLGRQQRPAA
ncbi:glycosyltransferase [Citrifermentans bremense]|uniref:glycosyltransferase n=1 Tax=Citrifermentans bremense TaxID=60035 RepID=UPI0004004C4D|nr:glycosyltransferase [Citrifermentans bremense]